MKDLILVLLVSLLYISFIHKDDFDIHDLATVSRYLYYITEKGVHKKHIHNDGIPLRKVASNEMVYEYIDGFTLSNSKVLLVLKGKEPQFSYVITTNTEKVDTNIRKLESFENFTEDMKVTVINDYLLIPAKNKGFLMYQYIPNENILKHIKTFSEIPIDDITVSLHSTKKKIVDYLCDSNKGIASYTIDTETNEITYGEFIEEFIGAKTVNWILCEEDNKLLVILEGMEDSAKVIILSINLRNLAALKYGNIRLLDGSPRYGSAGYQYTSIVMPNSIFVTETIKKSDSMHRYFNIEGIDHAKTYNKGSESWMIYATEDKIVGNCIMGSCCVK